MLIIQLHYRYIQSTLALLGLYLDLLQLLEFKDVDSTSKGRYQRCVVEWIDLAWNYWIRTCALIAILARYNLILHIRVIL